MMNFHGLRQGRLVRLVQDSTTLLAPSDVLWIDLLDPTHEEEKAMEALLGLQVPTRQEMAEIEEESARIQVTFVLTKTHLVSVRYADLVPFRSFVAKSQRQPEAHTTSDSLLASLLESIVERAADVLEMVAADLNEVSTRLFVEDRDPKRRKAKRFEDELQVLINGSGART
jgi:magnesium transporter